MLAGRDVLPRRPAFMLSALLALVAVGGVLHAAPGAPQDGRRLVWSDEFIGSSLDQTKWKFHATMNSTDCVYTNDSRTARVEGGCLHLMVVPSGDPKKPHILPRGVSTRDRMAFRYGYLEMRAKIPFRHGAWPSFWMTAQPKLQKAAWMSEVDIFEVFSSSNAVVANLHKWSRKKGHLMLPGGEGSLKRAHVFGDCAKVNINNEIFTPGHGWCPKKKRITADDKLPIDYWIDWIRLYQKDGEQILATKDGTTWN